MKIRFFSDVNHNSKEEEQDLGIQNFNDEWIHDDESLKNMVISYYLELFASDALPSGRYIFGASQQLKMI